MQCFWDHVPGSSLFGLASVPVEVIEPPSLESQGIKLHELIGMGRGKGQRPETRYFFMLPGRLVSTASAHDDPRQLVQEAIHEATLEGSRTYCMDLSPSLTVEYINAKTIRIYNGGEEAVLGSSVELPEQPEEDEPDRDLDHVEAVLVEAQAAHLTPQKGASSAPSLGTPAASPEKPGGAEVKHVKEEIMTLSFQKKEECAEWVSSILHERNRLCMPEIALLDSDFAQKMQVKLWKHIRTESSFDSHVLRSVFYPLIAEGAAGPGQMLLYLYTLMKELVGGSKANVLRSGHAFLNLVTILATNLTARLLILGCSLSPDFLSKFETVYKVLAAEEAKNTSAADHAQAGSEDASLAQWFGNLIGTPKKANGEAEPARNAVLLVELCKFIVSHSAHAAWAENRRLLPLLMGYPVDHPAIESEASVEWFHSLNAGTAKFIWPIKITWPQLKLLLEPTNFCGYFFVDYAVENDDVKRARAACAILTYHMSDRFPAIHVNTFSDVPEEAAHFIHYLEWDSLQRGYEEFELRNKSNQRLLDIIQEVRKTYPVPIVTASHIDVHQQGMTREAIMRDFMEQLLSGVPHEPTPELRVLRLVIAAWMEHTKKTALHYEVPRKAHNITLLALARWATTKYAEPEEAQGASTPYAKYPHTPRKVPSNTPSKLVQGQAVIGRVAPSEDRAMFSSIIASFFVKFQARKVHVLYSNEARMQHDFERMATYFKAFGITTAIREFPVMADVTFCMQKDLTHYYRDSVFGASAPLVNTMLVIDDVAALASMDAAPNSIFGKVDEPLTVPIQAYFDLFIRDGDSAALTHPDPLGATPLSQMSWEKAKLAYDQYKVMKEGKPHGYMVTPASAATDNHPVYTLLDEHCNPVPNKYNLGMEFLKYKLTQQPPAIHSKFFFQSLPHILGQYEGVIFGLEVQGSAPAGQNFLKLCFGGWTFDIPTDEFQHVFESGLLSEDGELKNDKGLFAPVDASEEAKSSLPNQGMTTPARDNGAAASQSVAKPPMDPHTSLIIKGQMMNELCERFYAKHPYRESAGTVWPSKVEHRKMIDFLENDSLHEPVGIEAFAVSVGLAREGEYGIAV